MNPAACGNGLGNGFPEFGQALRGAIMRPALVERLLRGVDNVLRRPEIGFADLEVDDTSSLSFEGPGFDEDLECGFGANSRHGGGKLHNLESFQPTAN
jgi:hypothetical protein